ncbi:MAG: YbjN domain-containing protein [Pseudomonadota bacterium]
MRLALIFCCLGSAAVSQEMVEASRPDSLLTVMVDAGYTATLTTDGVGDPKIESSVGGAEFDVFFYGCDNGVACQEVIFSVGFDLPNGFDLAGINEWNSVELYGQAWLDEENDPFLDMAINMRGGIPRANFEAHLTTWDFYVGEFITVIDW